MVLMVSAKKGTRINFIAAPGGLTLRKELDIEFVTQQPMGEWCWAACSTMIINTLNATDPKGVKAEICKVASFKMGVNCCLKINKKDCDNAQFPNSTPDIFTHFKLSYNKSSCPPSKWVILDYNTIKDEIDGGRPVIALIQWNGGGSHVVVISGYDDRDETIRILNPLAIPGQSSGELHGSYKFSYFKENSLGTWKGTYYRFFKKSR